MSDIYSSSLIAVMQKDALSVLIAEKPRYGEI